MLAKMVHRKIRVDEVIGFMDGLSLKFEWNSDLEVENTFYDGYRADIGANKVLIYERDGKFILCEPNFPGSWHDASIRLFFLVY